MTNKIPRQDIGKSLNYLSARKRNIQDSMNSPSARKVQPPPKQNNNNNNNNK